MKVYIVRGDNGESYEDHYWWNESVFAKFEDAEQYIRDIPARYAEDKLRIDELERREPSKLTEDEKAELQQLWGFWYDYNGVEHYSIDEYEVR